MSVCNSAVARPMTLLSLVDGGDVSITARGQKRIVLGRVHGGVGAPWIRATVRVLSYRGKANDAFVSCRWR